MAFTCFTGMALQDQSDPRFPNEPAFCMEITEVPQDAYIASLPEPQRSTYVAELKGLDGPKKPAVLVSPSQADIYCAKKYPQGATPTWTQWQIACGNKPYCTASGTLNHEEAVYGAGPADVDFGPANANGVKNMTGNVWEWLRDWKPGSHDEFGPGKNQYALVQNKRGEYRYFTGGSYVSSDDPAGVGIAGLAASFRRALPYYDLDINFGFRCVAPPLNSKK